MWFLFQVFYIQKQNSNFTDEFPELICDAAPDIPWFTEALGKAPDAVNFWMGDDRAVTSSKLFRYLLTFCVVDLPFHKPTFAVHTNSTS